MPAASGPIRDIKPYSWAPSESWDGADGDWSSFGLRVGSPEQGVRVLPSTAGSAVWVVAPEGCIPGERGKMASVTCSDSRGELFNKSLSTSWNDTGIYTMGLELNLGLDDSAAYGFDKVALGVSEAIGGLQLDEQVVAVFGNDDYYVGMFGLNQQPTNLTNLTNPHPSFLATLKAQNLIPSLSWGYTAGARYQLKGGVFASLTLGGYDSSRIVPNNVSFSLNPDVSRDLVVGLQTITAEFLNGSAIPLLPDPIWTFIDSTIPYIYLPLEACQEFERAFGLVWNSTYETYFVDEDVHKRLSQANLDIRFRLADSKNGDETVDISLPYPSFDLVIDYPLVPSNLSGVRYFPLKRASNESQYTLGRTFLQEAYLVTNYEQSNYSIFQSVYKDGVKPKIVAISSVDTAKHVSRAVKVGSSVGATLFLLLCLLIIILTRRKRRKASGQGHRQLATTASVPSQQPEIPDNSSSMHEIGLNSLIGLYREFPDNGKAELYTISRPTQLSDEAPGHAVPTLGNSNEHLAHNVREPRNLRGSYQEIIGQNRGAKNKHDLSGHSWTGVGTSKGTPHVETIFSSQETNQVYLDRSLPPTPISESMQSSPVVTKFGQLLQKRRATESLPKRSHIVRSVHGDMRRVSSPTPLNAWQRAFAHLSYSSMDMEIVVPPESSEVDIIEPLRIYKKNGRRRQNFF